MDWLIVLIVIVLSVIYNLLVFSKRISDNNKKYIGVFVSIISILFIIIFQLIY